jgi:hypothetical protein
MIASMKWAAVVAAGTVAWFALRTLLLPNPPKPLRRALETWEGEGGSPEPPAAPPA